MSNNTCKIVLYCMINSISMSNNTCNYITDCMINFVFTSIEYSSKADKAIRSSDIGYIGKTVRKPSPKDVDSAMRCGAFSFCGVVRAHLGPMLKNNPKITKELQVTFHILYGI